MKEIPLKDLSTNGQAQVKNQLGRKHLWVWGGGGGGGVGTR